MTSKAEYLKRYISGSADDKRKKKKKAKVPLRQTKTKLVDDDVDWRELMPEMKSDDEDEFVADEEGQPQVAEFVDEQKIAAEKMKWRQIDEQREELEEEEEEDVGDTLERHDSDESSPRRQRLDSDNSPPRTTDKSRSLKSHKVNYDSDESPPRQQAEHETESDESPPRTKRRDKDISQRRKRKDDRDALDMRQKGSSTGDLGSKVRQPNDSKAKTLEQKMKRSLDKRQSLSRKRHDSDDSPPRKVRRDDDSDDEHASRHMTITGRSKLGNKDQHKSIDHEIAQSTNDSRRTKSGLQTSAVLREENRLAREKENEMFDKMDREVSGRGADTVFRDKEGRRIDSKLEKIKQRQTEEEQARHEEKYSKWGRGVAQQRMKEEELKDMIHEMNKPLARYKDDEDLDKMLREQERSGDPMLEFMKRKKERREEASKKPARPVFKGSFPPNRFNIRPGYRWDSVDRSNGYEKERFLRISGREAWKEEAYKWSIEEM